MPGREDRRRLRIGRRRGCRGDGWARQGPRAGRGLGCQAVSAAPWPARARGGKGRPPRAPPGPARPPPPCGSGRAALRLRLRPQDPRPPAASAASPAGGAMGCGNSTATNPGAGRGERAASRGAGTATRGRGGGRPPRLERSGGRRREGGVQGAAEGGHAAPLCPSPFRDRSRPPALGTTEIWAFPPRGGGHAWARRACRAVLRTERGEDRRRGAPAPGGLGILLGRGPQRWPAPSAPTPAPRPCPQPLGSQTLNLGKCSRAIQDFLRGAGGASGVESCTQGSENSSESVSRLKTCRAVRVSQGGCSAKEALDV